MSCTDRNEVVSDVKSTNSISTLLFDWDGTLVDSADLGLAIAESTARVLVLDSESSLAQVLASAQ